MKMRKFLIFSLCAVIMLTLVPPVRGEQVYTYEYEGLVITSITDISNYLSVSIILQVMFTITMLQLIIHVNASILHSREEILTPCLI